MKIRAIILSLFLLLLGALPIVDAFAAAGSAEPPFRFYSTADGLTQSDVYDIEQDSIGYLWFTTKRGLNRYDGKDFDQFTTWDGLPANALTALYIDSDDTIWVGDTDGSISVIRATVVEQIIKPVGDGNTPVIDIASVASRILLIADGVGVQEIVMDDEAYRLESIGGESIGATAIAVTGNDVWIAAASGLYRLTLDPEPEFHLLSDEITHVHTSADGTLWVADRDKRVGIWKDGRLDVRAIIDTPNELIDLVVGAHGTVWIATPAELFSFDGTRTDTVQMRESMRQYNSISDISSLFVDSENTLWLSNDARLIRYLGERFRHFRLKTDSDYEIVWTISEDNEGRMWFGTQTKLLRMEADETVTMVGPDHGIPRGAVRDIVRGHAGFLWVGIRGEGLYRLDTGTLRSKLISSTKGLEILDVAVANDGLIWFSTFASGVFRYSPNGDGLIQFPSPENAAVYTLDVWEDNSIYYAAESVGLVHLMPQANGSFDQEYFDTRLALPNSSFDQIRMIGENELWVATEEGGLYRFDSGHFSSRAGATPWENQTVYVVEVLDNGSVIVGGEQGLYQFYPGSQHIAHYDRLSGFAGTETNVHATFIDSKDRLWIGTVDGATSMDTNLPIPEHVELEARILHMDTTLDGLTVTEGTGIDSGQRGVRIEFAAVSLLHPRGIQYSYKLVGVESQWSAATSNRSVNYSGIPPGSYEFMVKARHAGGEWSRKVSSRRFTVLPLFWQNLWFKLLTAGFILLALRATMIYRTGKIEKLNATLREQVRERTRSIKKAKQKLQLSNEKLSREINERQKADRARAEVEVRFSRAFDSAPFGMCLLNDRGQIFDANPQLRRMFCPDLASQPSDSFTNRMDSDNRELFMLQFDRLTTAELDSVEERLCCANTDNELLHIVVHLSAVRTETGDFQYAVMQVQDVTESTKLTGLLEYQASYDELTGLLNRRSFEAKLEQAWEKSKASGARHYLIYLDLDQFKVVNDTSGHTAGDQLLRNVSDIFRGIVRANDSVCRLGGDEFGIILWNCPTDVAVRISESIRVAIEEVRFQWDTEIYRIGVSIGGLPIDPIVGDTSELQQLADAACYSAKEAGRNRVHMVSGEKDSARVRRHQVRWVQRLREAMDNNRFAMYGQIIKPVHPEPDEPEHIEILLRLRDSQTRKLVPPGAFLPAAERYGMSIELDRWVVSTLIDTLFVHQSFQSEYRQYWINLSGISVGDTRFAQFLVDAVKRSPLPPGMINFEITETAVMRSIVEAGKLMSELREMGCRFALDDFGSGMSSFGYLKKLQVDILKIDGMFIRDILKDETDRIFVKSIIDIAHTLNIKTVAEFVENQEMFEVVRTLGSDYVQGFGIGRPFALAPHFQSLSDADLEPAPEKQEAG